MAYNNDLLFFPFLRADRAGRLIQAVTFSWASQARSPRRPHVYNWQVLAVGWGASVHSRGLTTPMRLDWLSLVAISGGFPKKANAEAPRLFEAYGLGCE